MLYILGFILICIYLNYKINKFADKINPYYWHK